MFQDLFSTGNKTAELWLTFLWYKNEKLREQPPVETTHVTLNGWSYAHLNFDRLGLTRQQDESHYRHSQVTHPSRQDLDLDFQSRHYPQPHSMVPETVIAHNFLNMGEKQGPSEYDVYSQGARKQPRYEF